jgi:hypothetical protein
VLVVGRGAAAATGVGAADTGADVVGVGALPAFAAAASRFFFMISENPPPFPLFAPPPTAPKPGILSAGLAAGVLEGAADEDPPSITAPAPFGTEVSLVSAFFNLAPP